ncbi:MAG: hypothetical protein J6U20_12260 [Fibrobacter sp.]|nr:hypothetical protein [Fibrobacter sp.]
MNHKIKAAIVMLSLSCTAMAAGTLSENGAIEAYVPHVAENVSASASFHVNNAYAYAPATVYHNGYFHQFYCSTGNATDMYYDLNHQFSLQSSWDHVRYRYSKNGSDWTNPHIVLTSTFSSYEGHTACDPAIVYDERDGYWYLFYQGTITNYGGAIYVSRSKNLKGPFEKYSADNNWYLWPLEPAPLLKKRTGRSADDPNGYGIGQISVVRQGGKFHVWFNQMMNNDFVVYNNSNEKVKYTKRFYVAVDNITDLKDLDMGNTFDDPVDSRIHVVRHVEMDTAYNDQNSIVYRFPAYSEKWHFTDFGEVRWNADANRFEMWLLDREFGYMMRVKKYYSTNGYSWYLDNKNSWSYNIVHENNYMNWVHNLGISGDKFGHIHNDKYLLSFSAPRNSGYYDDSWLINNGYTMQDPATGANYVSIQRGIWSMWEILNGANWEQYNVNYSSENTFDADTPNRLRFFVGDFDGDGIDELGAVEELRTREFKWYLGSSKSPNRHSPIWGQKMFSRDGYLTYKIITGDYDGDGKTDFGVVTFKDDRSYWNIYSSKTGNIGVNYIPANQKIPSISSTHTILNGDFDGDGIADVAAFQSSTKKWYMRSSIDGKSVDMSNLIPNAFRRSDDFAGFIELGINSTNLKPIAADFDGDHITDIVVADSVQDAWYIYSSFTKKAMETGIYNGCRITHWPLYLPYSVNASCAQEHSNQDHSNYQFLAGDFDGDGIADKLIVHRSNGSAKAIMSRGGQHNFNATYTNVRRYNSDPLEFIVGDFDGNGYSDFCIVNTATRNYYIKFFKSNGATVMTDNYISKPVKNVDLTASYPLAKKAIKPAEPEIAQETALPNFNAFVQDQKLIVSNAPAGQKVTVFDIHGNEISRKVSNGLDLTFDIPSRGVYIVRSGSSSRRISIK